MQLMSHAELSHCLLHEYGLKSIYLFQGILSSRHAVAQSQMKLPLATDGRDSLECCDCDVMQYGDGSCDPVHVLYRFL